MRRALFLTLAAVLALAAAGGYAYTRFSRATTLRIAAGPLGGEDVRMMSAFAKALGRGHSDIRLKLDVTDGPAASAAALAAGKTDLAVARTDIGLGEGLTVLIMRQVAAVFVVPGGSEVNSLADIAGGELGVVRGAAANLAFVDTVLRLQGLDPARVEKRPLNPSEVRGALEGGMRAFVIVGAPTGPTAADVVATMAHVTGTEPRFLALNEADAIASRLPTLESLDVLRGTFGTSPARPPATVKTLATTQRLVARPDLDDGVAGDLAKAIFAVRPEVLAEAPLAAAISAPEETKGGALPVHPGAAAWLDGEEKTFFDRYGDLFYIGAMLIGVAGSAVAGLAGLAPTARRRRTDALLAELTEAAAEARAARSPEALALARDRIDAVAARTVREAASRGVDLGMMGVFALAIDQARQTLNEARAELVSADLPLIEPRALLRAGGRV